MKKSEIVQLALIILGIGIIVRTLISFLDQVVLLVRYSEEIKVEFIWVYIIIAILFVLIFLGSFLVFKSKTISKKIIGNEQENKTEIAINKNEIIHVSIIILSLYFLVSLFVLFINAIFMIIRAFLNDFIQFREMFPEQIWVIILYISILIILMNSRKFSIWLEGKIK